MTCGPSLNMLKTLAAATGEGGKEELSPFFPAPMKTVCVLQHTETEYLGLMEDHLEARSVRFQYSRPFTAGGKVPPDAEGFDGLVVLSAGPMGVVSGSLLPSLGPELRLISDFIKRGLPVIGVGLGAVMVATAAGGGAEEAPLRFTVTTAHRKQDDALAGFLPETFPAALYMRDDVVLPEDSTVLAADDSGTPLVFQVGEKAFGFLGHPGIKSAMVEDLIMEFDECPDNTAQTLEALREVQGGIADALTPIMIGLVMSADWMSDQGLAQQ
jgi:GMP synthase-like glutamine amidotransferase